MMAYCTIDDVRSLNPRQTYDANSTPTVTQVEGFIGNIAAEIDTILRGRGLTVPITEPADFLVHLKQLNAYGAAAIAEMGMYPGAQGPTSTTHGQELWRMYTKGRDALYTMSVPLSSAAPFSHDTEHPTTAPERKITKGKEF